MSSSFNSSETGGTQDLLFFTTSTLGSSWVEAWEVDCVSSAFLLILSDWGSLTKKTVFDSTY